MTPPQPAWPVPPYGVSRLLMLAAVVLFALAACCAGGVITGVDAWAFGFGGFAAWAAAWVVPLP